MTDALPPSPDARVGWRLVGLAGLALLLGAGCGPSWRGDASVTTTEGQTVKCVALELDRYAVLCHTTTGSVRTPWRNVAGYRAGNAR